MSNPEDKRKHPRIELILKINYTSRDEFLADYTQNASGGGVFISTNKPFSVGDHLVFDISFPGLLSPIRCEGQVRWRTPPDQATEEKPAGIGVSFTFPSEEKREEMARLLDQLNSAVNQQQTLAQQDPRPFRILLAEDNPLVREMFCFGVKKFHRTRLQKQRELIVDEAENGKVAWDRLQLGPFDLAIIDFYMPVLDGEQLVKMIRGDKFHHGMPVVVVSVGGEEARKSAYAAGADLFLDKPVLLGQLFESLQRLLNLEKA